MAQPEILIHAGAHRTGSSSFQMCLHLNAGVIRAAGCDLAYPSRDGAPGGDLQLKLPRPRDNPDRVPEFARRVRWEIDRHCQGRPRLLLSEENILGRMLHFQKGQFYPARRQRFAALRSGLPGPVAHLLLVVRPYHTLFPSAWRLRAQARASVPFDRLRPVYMGMTEGWPDLVRDLRDTLAPARLSVVDQRTRPDRRALLAELVPGLDARTLIEPAKVHNASLPDDELRARQIALHQAQKGGRSAARVWQGEGAVAAFSADEVAELSDRYVRDLDTIAGLADVALKRRAA